MYSFKRISIWIDIKSPWAEACSVIFCISNHAAIHQLGGNAGINKKVSIPPRPYLKLTDNDFAEILIETEKFLK